MEMEPRTPEVVKKLWSVVRAVAFAMRKGMFSKSKLMVDLHILLQRGKLAGKAIGSLMLHHYSTFTCRSDDDVACVSASTFALREYEFSCSNTPANNLFFPKRGSKHRHHHSRRRHHLAPRYNDAVAIGAVQKVLEMLNSADVVEASPMLLPGFGKSPVVRQLRITDSPFPLKDDDGDGGLVDAAAEEFIRKFHKDLRLQKTMASVESPYHYGVWG
ncbi:hypothetical protein BT93_L2026 [Corymbia citriodora subsp. variegata]|uniref:Avr9/Cf-9 rapidly elicited protein 146 n=1 Tax=Corymbia citriodora subsp. variegata TaxID=360336 RepID=A0A8T0CW87_CORYI|nr:hypothetical protein BT93_L2026 [Corymbia citriodora subsp. variegata]